MTKRRLTDTEAFDLRQGLQVATLDALMASRRWEPGDLVFQGGTSLHLAHGSPRFSEDLDFLVNSSLRLASIADSVQDRLRDTRWTPDDTQLTVSKFKDHHNPHSFIVALGGPEVIGSVRVKVELWLTPQVTLSGVKTIVAPVRLARGAASGMQTFVPTEDLQEVYVDKVFALAARNRLKPRDVFDLYWLRENHGLTSCSAEEMQLRLETYPNQSPSAWISSAFNRKISIISGVDAIAMDLKRWLPSSWPLTRDSARAMAACAVHALEQGLVSMHNINQNTPDEIGNENDRGLSR